MATIVLRSVKGSPLTNTELDNNFSNINTEVQTKLDAATYTAADVLTKIKTVDGIGSGLDADLIDGLNTSSTMPGSADKSSVVTRDASGNFVANVITASLTGNATNVSGTVAIANGGTGAVTAPAALVGLGERTDATGSIVVPSGTTAQRDSTPAPGYLRYNNSTNTFEGYSSASWGSLGGGSVEYVVATGTSSAYVITPIAVITTYAAGQSWEVNFTTECIDSPTAAVSGLPSKNIVILATDGTYQNAAARDIVVGTSSTLELIDIGSGVLKFWLKDPAVDHSNLTSVSVNTAFTIANALNKIIKSTGTVGRTHTLPVYSTWPLEGKFELICENSSMQVVRQNAADVIDYYGVNLATNGSTGAFIEVPTGTQLKFIKTATGWQVTNTRSSLGSYIDYRQSLQYGALTSAGLPNLITQAQVGNTLATGVATNGTFFASVGNGFCVDGSQFNVNRVRTLSLNFPNLAASSTNYLWYDTNADSSGSVTVADLFQYGGTIPVTNNQHTYDYLNHIMYVGNGTTAVQSNRLIIAEVDTNATVVTAIRVRAYAGKYDSGYTNTLVGAAGTYTKNHNIGTQEIAYSEVLQCITADNGFSVGDILKDVPSAASIPAAFQVRSNTITTRRPSSSNYGIPNITTGTNTALTLANWKYKLIATRNF